jgi:hypothetical protein
VRRLVDADRLRAFMGALGSRTDVETTCYLAGGASAVIVGWRNATVDIDVLFAPENDQLLRAIPDLKQLLEVNVELAFPGHFVPMPGGWEDRSAVVERVGAVTFRNVDFYAQALAKLERGHDRDLADVEAMISLELVDPERLRAFFTEIEPDLYRFPAIDPAAFRSALEDATNKAK